MYMKKKQQDEYMYICYGLIRNLAHFKAGQPALKPAGQLRNGPAEFTTAVKDDGMFQSWLVG